MNPRLLFIHTLLPLCCNSWHLQLYIIFDEFKCFLLIYMQRLIDLRSARISISYLWLAEAQEKWNCFEKLGIDGFNILLRENEMLSDLRGFHFYYLVQTKRYITESGNRIKQRRKILCSACVLNMYLCTFHGVSLAIVFLGKSAFVRLLTDFTSR